VETLKIITQAFLDAEPDSLVKEMVDHLSKHNSNIAKGAATVLDVVARSRKVQIMEDMFDACSNQLNLSPNCQMYEAILGGYAAVGSEAKVRGLVKSLQKGECSRQKVSVRGYSLIIKGFLKNGMLDATLAQLEAMHKQNVNVPSFAVSETFRVAKESKRTAEVYNRICDNVVVSSEVAAMILEDACAVPDLDLTKRVEQKMRQSKVQMTFSVYEGLLKAFISAGDSHALELFAEMQELFSFISDGFCTTMISRCAETKFVRCAEAIAGFQRSRGKMTIVAYSALMKVYSHSGMFSEACDLYSEITAQGLEPDAIMYGCLMKFSAECGRTDLARELFAKAPAHDIHHYMAMIRAAGQDKDVDKAFSILASMKTSGIVLDTFACNSVLDVCSGAGQMERARALVNEMRKDGNFDMVSYNTLLKGYGACGDTKKAKEVIAEMEEVGLQPNDISYNSLINMYASVGNFDAAWDTIQIMESKCVTIDHYTLSTMMKALKKSQAPRGSVGKVMALLDRHGVDLCCEEVLLNTTVEVCIKHNDHQRLRDILSRVEAKRSKVQFAAHTFGSLIRAASTLKRLDQCKELWKDMTEARHIEPSGVTLGCMLDALVMAGRMADAVALLRTWEPKIPANTVIYSTLIKGFCNARDCKRADEMWQELIAKKLPLNTVVFNAIIDAHARMGNIDRVTALVESMETAGCPPDDITWSMVAKGYCTVGEVDKAFEVFSTVETECVANAVIMFNTILDGCVRHNKAELGDKMIAGIEQWGIRPTNYTLGIIVKMCGRRNQLKRAFDAVETYPKKYGFTVNGPVLTCLFFACLRSDAVDAAQKVFQEHRDGGNPPDVKMYTALVSSYARGGRLEQAVALVEESYGLNHCKRMLPAGEELEPNCLEQLMKGLNRRGLMQKVGAPLLNKMRAAGVSGAARLMTQNMGQ